MLTACRQQEACGHTDANARHTAAAYYEFNRLLKPQQCACRLQVLNAMLLACCGDATSVAVEAMQYLLQEGAVPGRQMGAR